MTLRADGFHLFKAQISRQDVLDSIGDIDQYGEDVKGIMMNFALSLISDLELSIDLDLSTVNTTVNMTPIINSIMAVAKNSTYLKFPINLDLTNYDGTFTLRVATNYVNETGDGRMLLELKAPSGDPLITAYNENDRTYVDLTGLGFMKFCLTGVNLFQTVRGLLGADMAAEDFVEEVAPAIAMSSFTSGVEIDSDYVGVAVNSYLVTMILRMLAMDLGMDVDLQAHLGFDGSIEATLGLGSVAALGINMSLGKESETEHRIVDILNDLTIAEYGVYDTFDAEALVDSILVAERLNLAIDLYNHNVDVIGNEDYHENKSRIVIRNSAATDKDHPEVFSNGLAAPYKSIVLAIYAGWTNSSSAALLYGYIDLDGDKVQIKGTRNLLRVSIVGQEVTGELVDVPIPNLGLKKKLVDALSGLFGESGDDFGGAIEVPDGALPAQKPSVEHKCKHACPFCGECLDATCTDPVCKTKATCNGVHCEHACSVCGRCLDKTSTKDVCKNKCDGLPECTIEQIIPGITISLSGNMDIDVDANINGEYISAVLKDLLTGVFTDMDISSITGSDKHKHQNVTYSNTVANTFYNSLWDNVIAPLISAQVPVVGGAISGLAGLVAKDTVHTTVQRFLPISDVKNLKVNLSITDGRVANITAIGSNPNNNLGFGLYVFNKKADNVVSWENQATYIYYNPTLGGKALIDMFEKKARKHEGDNWEVDSWANISWTLKDTNVSHETFCDNLSQYETGKEYTFVGTAWGENLEVTVFLHDSKVKSVKDMQVKAMREIPSYVTAVFADGSERIIPDVEIVCNRVNGEKNASVTINDENYEFTIVFEEEDITLDTLVLNAYDYLDVINSL
ncbi:MAG: hypothetical protein K2I23_07355, partial [Clostridia bacterium]|nr:hypothetical protein [Clostridia bacterium]